MLLHNRELIKSVFVFSQSEILCLFANLSDNHETGLSSRRIVSLPVLVIPVRQGKLRGLSTWLPNTEDLGYSARGCLVPVPRGSLLSVDLPSLQSSVSPGND